MIDSIEKEIFVDLVCCGSLITVVEGFVVFNKFEKLMACGDDWNAADNDVKVDDGICW